MNARPLLTIVAAAVVLSAFAASPTLAQFRGDAPLPMGAGDQRLQGETAYFFVELNPPRLVATHDGGRTFGPVTNFGDTTSASLQWARFDADQDVVVVAAFEHFGGGHGGSGPAQNFLVYNSTDGGQTFTMQRLERPNLWRGSGPPTVRVQGSHVDLFWGESDPDYEYTWYHQRSLDGGHTWLPQARRSENVDEEWLLADGGTFHAFLDVNDPGIGYRRIVYRRSEDGSTWSDNVRIDSYPNDGVQDMFVNLEAGVLSVAWREREEGGSGHDTSDFYFRRSVDGGRTWEPIQRLNSNAPEESSVVTSIDIAVAGTRAIAAYTLIPNPGRNEGDLWTRISNDGGATWSAPERRNPIVSQRGRPMEDCRCFIVGTGLYVSWFDWQYDRGNGRRLLVTSTFDDGATWRLPFPLRSHPGHQDTACHVSFDAIAGSVVVRWSDRRNGALESWGNFGQLQSVDPVACRTGNVGGAIGNPVDVLFVNGSAGGGPERVVVATRNEPLHITLQRPPSAGSEGELPYVLYSWIGVPGPDTVSRLSGRIGDACMPMVFGGGLPGPTDVFNTWGFTDKLGVSTRPTRPAPGVVVRAPSGVGRTIEAFVQAIVPDRDAPNGIAAVTNGIELRVVE